MRLQKKLGDLILFLQILEFPLCRSTIRREDFLSKWTDLWICDWIRKKGSVQPRDWIQFQEKNLPGCYMKIRMSRIVKNWQRQSPKKSGKDTGLILRQSYVRWSNRPCLSFRKIRRKKISSGRPVSGLSRHFELTWIMNLKYSMNLWKNCRALWNRGEE